MPAMLAAAQSTSVVAALAISAEDVVFRLGSPTAVWSLLLLEQIECVVAVLVADQSGFGHRFERVDECIAPVVRVVQLDELASDDGAVALAAKEPCSRKNSAGRCAAAKAFLFFVCARNRRVCIGRCDSSNELQCALGSCRSSSHRQAIASRSVLGELIATIVAAAELHEIQQRVTLLRCATAPSAIHQRAADSQRPLGVAIQNAAQRLIARRISELREERHHPMGPRHLL